MEENVDSIKNTSNKENDLVLKKAINEEKNKSIENKKDLNIIDNEEIIDKTSNNTSNDGNKEKVTPLTSNNTSNDGNKEKVTPLTSNNTTNVVNKEKVTPLTSNNTTNVVNKEKITPLTSNNTTNVVNKEKAVATSKEVKIKPKKELPIEKKPFNEFVNDHLLPSIIYEFKNRGLEVKEIFLKNTSRPIAGDKCWVIYCDIKDICNFWLSFEKEDISSSKSISLCKSNQKPSVIESFLIDEKRITLKLIISRILQRLNGQKLIGSN